MSKTVLLTAAGEDSRQLLDLLEDNKVSVIHLPLERYVEKGNRSAIENMVETLSEFENIAYGSLINARFFMQQLERRDRKEAVRKLVNLTLDEETAAYLEDHGIPAICTFAGGKAINAVEFMLRMRRLGRTLYPCGSHRKEELPGLLQELEIPVEELELYELEGPRSEELEAYRSRLVEMSPDVVLFHSRRSVNRTLAAFPDLNYGEMTVVSADRGVSKHLEEKGVTVTKEAEGTWQSIADLL